MRLISFDSLRTWDIPGVYALKPESWFQKKEIVRSADWILFPEYWQVNALVYAWKKRIFPSVTSYHLGHDKVEMIRAFEAVVPANIPFTRILSSTAISAEQILDEFDFPFVAKEVRSCRGEGVFLIENQKDFLNYTRKNDILYVQEYLPIQRDLRVVIIGQKAVAAYWREAAEGRFHNNVSQGGIINFEGVPDDAIQFVEQAANELGIDHAGFDVAELDGHYYLMEFNVRFGTQALNHRCIRLGRLIFQYLQDNTLTPWKPGAPQMPKAS